MKFKAIARSEKLCTQDVATEVRKRARNTAPELHPFSRAREYKRALNATKLDKVFAKPFIGALEGHSDGVWCSAAPHSALVQFISGSCDGEVRVWDLASKRCVWNVSAHRGIVKGLSIAPHTTRHFVSVGDDCLAKLWEITGTAHGFEADTQPLTTFTAKNALTGVDHHWSRNHFATSSEEVEIWDHEHSSPIHSFKWGSDATLSVKFNPAEPELLASTGRDRSIGLYDLRAATPIRKVVLGAFCSSMAWNPREPYYFVCANEDSNLYSFDMRFLKKPVMIHKDHVGAVLTVGYSPTGKEFVSGGYDRMLRIFEQNSGRSREVYHGRRMGRIFCANYSQDGRFVLSGSDDANVRIWKAQASKSVAKAHPRAAEQQQYTETLKATYEHMPEIRRIAKHRHVPKVIKKQHEKLRLMRESERRKEGNRRRYSKPGTQHEKPEREAAVIAQVE